MAIADDWTISTVAKTITHTANTTTYTALEMYTWLMDVFDELDYMDDDVPMSAQTPTEFTLINGWSIPDASYRYIKGGAITDTTNNDVWVNFYTLGTIESGTTVYVIQNGSKLTKAWWSADDPSDTGHMDGLIRTYDSGAAIDNGDLLFMARELGDLYDHFPITAISGRNAIPLATSSDLNNTSTAGDIADNAHTNIDGTGTNADINITFGTISRDLNNGNGSKNYDVEIDCNNQPLADVYEVLKWVTRRGSTTSLNSTDGEQYLSANASYTEVKASPFGTFAGGTFFGARGVWLANVQASEAQNYQLYASDNSLQVPPVTIAVQVSGLEVDDKVCVFITTGDNFTINKSLYTSHATSNSTGSTSFTVQESIDQDIPQTGALRIRTAAGVEERIAYTAWSGSVFTLGSAHSGGYDGTTTCYVGYIDKVATAAQESVSVKYDQDRYCMTVVRYYGGAGSSIIPFRTKGPLTTGGYAATAIRTDDSIVS
jgi:hypothetical protein